jgi:hypothetical protein
MANKKRRNNPRRRPARKNRSRRSTFSRSNVLKQLIGDTVNPFTRNAGSRIFDANCSPVIPYHSVRQIVLTSDANGHGAVVISPAWAEQMFLSPTVDSSNDMTALGSATVGSGYNSSTYESYRVVSVGVKVKSIVAPLDASGYVRATTDITTVAHSLTTPQNHLACKTVPLRSADFGVLSTMTGIEAYTTYPIATAADDFHGWTSITISVDGVPASTACLYLEVCANYELFPAAGQGQNQFAQKAAPAHSGIQGFIERARHTIGNFVEGGLAGEGASSLWTKYAGGTSSAEAEAGEGAMETIGDWAGPIIEELPEVAGLLAMA